MLQHFDLRRRAYAAAVHLLISGAVVAVVAGLVFGLWYPGPYRLLSGGRGLFFLVSGVDVVLGPLLTFAVFDMTKGWIHLRRDLIVIGLLQAAALVYGLHAVYLVRPVAMVFEVDRFRVIAAGDVYLPELPKARPEYRSLPLTGPWLLGARVAAAGDERNDALFKGLDGFDTGQRPTFWQPYADSMSAAVARSRPVSLLLAHYPSRVVELREALHDMQADETSARFLPLMARGEWVVVIDSGGKLLGQLNVDGFF